MLRKKMMFVKAWREGRDKVRGGDRSHRVRGPRIIVVAPRNQCLPTALCRSIPRASHPTPCCATAYSRTSTLPASIRPCASTP